jgi:8-oxo-dGTP pyrophosphatase MutT (NUDIX family)
MAFVMELEQRLQRPLPGDAAHGRFSPRPPRGGAFRRTVPPDARQAAALILLYPSGDDAYSIPLTVRRSDLPDHAGQVSLPGGRIETGETAEAAALREAHEEIGVDPSTVRILGGLTPLFVLVSRFVITPFVGVVDRRPDFKLATREVAELLEVPLAHLRDPEMLKWGTRTREGYLVDFPYFEIGDHQLWGATAMMLGELLSILD